MQKISVDTFLYMEFNSFMPEKLICNSKTVAVDGVLIEIEVYSDGDDKIVTIDARKITKDSKEPWISFGVKYV